MSFDSKLVVSVQIQILYPQTKIILTVYTSVSGWWSRPSSFSVLQADAFQISAHIPYILKFSYTTNKSHTLRRISLSY